MLELIKIIKPELVSDEAIARVTEIVRKPVELIESPNIWRIYIMYYPSSAMDLYVKFYFINKD